MSGRRLMRIGTSCTCLLVAALWLGCASAPPYRGAASKPVPEAQPQTRGRVVAEVSSSEQRVIEATNAFRREQGLAPLRPSARLITIAQNHARNMARQDKYGDNDRNGHVLDGQSVEYRIAAGGYLFSRVAENVGYQLNRQDPVASMMDGWKRSAGHRRNILQREVTELGVGAAQGRSGRWYFVQLFGRPTDPARPIRTSN